MNIQIEPLTSTQIQAYLDIPDLTLAGSNHAVRLLYDKLKEQAAITHPQSEVMVYRDNPVVSIEDNYQNLLIPADNISRSSTYTHYIDGQTLLRTHASSAIPGAMRQLAARTDDWQDVIILVPGLVYRRDVADKKHVGQIHMLDVWRVVRTSNRQVVNNDTLLEVVRNIAKVAAPGWGLRIVDSPHPTLMMVLK